MKRRITTILIGVIIILLAFLYAHVDKNYYLYNRNQDSGDFIQTGILNGRNVQQTFQSQIDSFDGISIKCLVSGDETDVKVCYELTDDKTDQIVASGKVNAEEIDSGKFYTIRFDPINNARGKNYTLTLTEEGTTDTNGVGFYVAENDTKGWSQKLTIEGEEFGGSLAARVIHHGFDLVTLIMVLAFVIYIVIFMNILYKLFK